MADVVVVGSYVQDLSFRTEQLPAPGETRLGTFQSGAGGKGFNQAVACSRQGVVTQFLGAVANDLFAVEAENFVAHEESLTAFLERIDSSHTGVASIVVDGKAQNQIVVALGANGRLSRSFVQQRAALFHDAKIVVTQLEMNIEAVDETLSIARESSSISILDPAPINPELSVELLQKADVITPNESEFTSLLKQLFGDDPGERFWERTDKELQGLCELCGVPLVIVTLGGTGCFVSHHRLDGRISLGEGFFRASAPKVNAIDTTGAGDAFSGGLAAGLVRYRNDIKSAIAFASCVAGLSTERVGTSPAMPYSFEVHERFRELPSPVSRE